MRVRRKSRQREKIYEMISTNKSHPTAQWIYEMLKKEIPSLSLGNVYRNINILVEQSRIKRRDFGDGIERYDAITEIHYHFICEKCGNISDFNMPIQDIITSEAQKTCEHYITCHTIQFFGICESCRIARSNKNKSKG